MPQFPNFFSGLAQGAQIGSEWTRQERLMDLQESKLKLEQAELAKEVNAAQGLSELMSSFDQTEQAHLADRDKLLKVLPGLEQIATMPKDMRKGAVEGFVRGIEQQENIKLSDVFVNTLKTANSENLVPQIKALQTQAATDPTMTATQFMKTAASPVATSQALVQGSKAAQQIQTQGSPDPQVLQQRGAIKKAQFELTKLKNKQKALIAYGSRGDIIGTEAGKQAVSQANSLNSRINSLEGFLRTGVEAGMREAGKIETQAEMAPQLAAINQAQARGTEIGQAQGEYQTRQMRAETAATRDAAVTAAEETTKAAIENRQRVPGALGKLLNLPQGFTVGQLKDAGGQVPDATDTRTMFQAKAATARSLDMGGRMINMVAGRPELLSSAGAIARFTDSIVEQAIGLARLFNQEFEPELLEVDKYEATFKDIGIDSAELQSAIVGLSYASAQANESGKLSDQDIERNIRRIGAKTGSSGQFVNTLFAFLEDVDSGYRVRVEATTGIDPGPSSISTASLEELSALDMSQLSNAEISLLEKRIEFLERREAR